MDMERGGYQRPYEGLKAARKLAVAEIGALLEEACKMGQDAASRAERLAATLCGPEQEGEPCLAGRDARVERPTSVFQTVIEATEDVRHSLGRVGVALRRIEFEAGL